MHASSPNTHDSAFMHVKVLLSSYKQPILPVKDHQHYNKIPDSRISSHRIDLTHERLYDYHSVSLISLE